MKLTGHMAPTLDRNEIHKYKIDGNETGYRLHAGIVAGPAAKDDHVIFFLHNVERITLQWCAIQQGSSPTYDSSIFHLEVPITLPNLMASKNHTASDQENSKIHY